MEKLFMSAGIVIAIVLCIVGLVKLPFEKFKEKHPKCYKSLFTILSVVIAVGLSVLDELYILGGELLSADFIILIFVVLAGVFGGYSGVYEGLGLKELMKKLTENVKKAREMAEDKKAQKYLDKYLKVSGDFDKAIAIIEEKKENERNGEI